MNRNLSGKRLEVLREVIPDVRHIAVLAPSLKLRVDLGDGRPVTDLSATARSLAVELEFFRVKHLHEIEKAFATIIRKPTMALIGLAHPLFSEHRMRIVDLAANNRVPSMYPQRSFVIFGGLMSYGPNHSDLERRAAYYVDKILRGARLADLPIEQPTKFELVINLKTAKILGLTIPDEVLRWADEVIK